MATKQIQTQEAINRQIEGLLKMKQTLPEKSFFGDRNWEKIDTQVDVLKGNVKSGSLYHDESVEDFEESDNEMYFAALEAEDWLNGDSEDDLFEE